MVADDPSQKMKLKTSHCEIINDHDSIQIEANTCKSLPLTSEISQQSVIENFKRIKGEIASLIKDEIERILNTQDFRS